MEHVLLYDTTLRDGAQSPGLSFSSQDKVRIAQHLDALGVAYIEGGWPSASNARDIAFFEAMRGVRLQHAKLATFGSTCRAGVRAAEDAGLRQLVAFDVPVVTIFGKSWDAHVTGALRIELPENLRMIEDSVAFLRAAGVEVIYDAEHFFNGYLANPEYALATLRAAINGGAHCLALCDTNGGMLPGQITEAIRAVQAITDVPIGIHTHNDSELAVANSLAAIEIGVRHVQGTINGIGERCGNANLCAIIPALEVKMGMRALPEGNLTRLYEAAHFVAEVANVQPPLHAAYVGSAAFAHKAGVHIDALMKLPGSYEHMNPELVGNSTRYVVSDQAGSSAVVERAQRLGFKLDKKSDEARAILDRVKAAENAGYEFEAAEASFELLVLRTMGQFTQKFAVKDFFVIVNRLEDAALSQAIVRVAVNGVEAHTVADGDGPVHALDSALRKALEPHFPPLSAIRLTDFKVRVVNVRAGTAARVRVLVECADAHGKTWSTIGVHENIIMASLEALCDALSYGLRLYGLSLCA